MDIIEKSLQIALLAYSGNTDKGGHPYILHPLRVMSKMDNAETMSIALLHDVLEDTNWTANDLLKVGVPEHIVETVECLSKHSNETYEAYIKRIKQNKLATKVKLADLQDNLNVLRLNSLNNNDLQRIVQYHKAWKTLHEEE